MPKQFYLAHRLQQASFVLYSLLAFSTLEAAVHPKQEQADVVINQLYHKLKPLPKSTGLRIEIISSQFLGKPYRLSALGEGIQGRYDQGPQYRVDAFDCDTFVTTTLALALANNLPSFQNCLAKLRYQEGDVSFLKRNHFMSVDWNANNQRQGFIKDLTPQFKDDNQQLLAKEAVAVIDKAAWYQHLGQERIRLISANPQEVAKRLAELKNAGSELPQVKAVTPYIPLKQFFDATGKAKQSLFAKIPNGAIIDIVRPNWDLEERIGTHLNISHLGFAIWKKGILYFRHASSEQGQIVEVPLAQYLAQYQHSPTVKGISIQLILPKEPFNQGC